jgi:selenocysteine-specific elongation factor
VALTKTDLVSPQRVADATLEIVTALSATALSTAEVVPVSPVTGVGIDHLRQILFDAARQFGRRAATGRFRLAVDRSFTLVGIGTVVTGTILSGSIAVGDRVVVSPSGREAQVRSIHAQNRPAVIGQAGDRCALNLVGRNIHKDAIVRGDVVLDPALHAPTDRIDASLRILPSELKNLRLWTPVRLHHAAADVAARIVPLTGETIAPGTQAMVQLVLDSPIAAAVGDNFILRDTSGQRTLGGGRFLDLRGQVRKRRRPERLAELAAHARTDVHGALSTLLASRPGIVDLSAFSRDRALSNDEVESLVARTGAIRVVHAEGVVALAPGGWSLLLTGIRAALETFHAQNPGLQGCAIEQLRLQIEPKLPATAFVDVLQHLARTGAISLDRSWVRLSSHKVEMTESDEALWHRINILIGGSVRFHPPRVRDIAGHLDVAEQDVRRIMQLAGRKQLVHEIAHDHFLTRPSLMEIAEIVRGLAESAEDGAFAVAQLRDRLDISRKVAVHILEFFDRRGATARCGALRRVNVLRLKLFRSLTE